MPLKNMEIIKKNKLFAGLSDGDIEYTLDYFRARPAFFEKGELLSRPGEILSDFGLVTSGTVQVCMEDFDGNSIIMAIVTPGHTFGESLCFLGEEPRVNIYAVSDTTLLWLSPEKVKMPTSDRRDILCAERFVSMLATRTLEMNDRIQILSEIKLRDRLVTFFSQNTSRYGESFTLPLSREDMAAYLGTNRSALSRELSKMRDEGIIEFYRNNFTVKRRI